MKQILLVLLAIFLSMGCSNNKKSSLEKQIEEEYQEAIANLDSTKFEVLEEDFLPKVANYYLLYKGVINKDSLSQFVQDFRNVHCAPANIYLYDSKDIYPLCKQYPLEGKDYVFVADHFISESSFDCPNEIWLYPYQDELYKKYGGKNWKKEPIK